MTSPTAEEVERRAMTTYMSECIVEAMLRVRPRRRKWSTAAKAIKDKYRAAARRELESEASRGQA